MAHLGLLSGSKPTTHEPRQGHALEHRLVIARKGEKSRQHGPNPTAFLLNIAEHPE